MKAVMVGLTEEQHAVLEPLRLELLRLFVDSGEMGIIMAQVDPVRRVMGVNVLEHVVAERVRAAVGE